MDDCCVHGYVFIIGYVDWMCRSFHSGCVSLFSCPPPFSTMVFDFVVVGFDISLVVGEKVFLSNDGGTVN